MNEPKFDFLLDLVKDLPDPTEQDSSSSPVKKAKKKAKKKDDTEDDMKNFIEEDET